MPKQGSTRPTDLPERFLQYLQEERATEVHRLKQSDAIRVEAQKRIRQLDKEIEAIKGGAI